MGSLPAPRLQRRPISVTLVFIALLFGLVSIEALGQGSGRDSTGTGGNHIISGKVFFPSGRRAEGSIQVRLQTFGAGEISTIADFNGSFTFTSLAPGNYTVVVNAGDEYQIARENVTIESDLNLSRSGVSLNSGTRRYTVMVTLQPRLSNQPKPGVLNAALAQIPAEARRLYEKGIEQSKAGKSEEAIQTLKAAISLYPNFPLALNELGVQYLKLGEANRAIEPLRSAAKLSPDAFTPKLNFGVALLETQQYSDAEIQLRAALKITSAPTAHMYLGLTLAHLNNGVEAEKELKVAIDSGGDQLALAHYYLGGLYWQRHDYRRAADALETYLRLAPNAPDAERVRGTIKQLRAKS